MYLVLKWLTVRPLKIEEKVFGSVEPRMRKYVKGYGFLSLARNLKTSMKSCWILLLKPV